MKNEEKLREVLSTFNPNTNGLKHHGIFGLPFSEEEAGIILIPVPWEVTVSYKAGTAKSPEAILAASQQIDLYDALNPGGWKAGIAMEDAEPAIENENDNWREKAVLYIQMLEAGTEFSDAGRELLRGINTACAELVELVRDETSAWLNEGRFVGLVGGDHSTPLGFMHALAEKHPKFGILQIDAHADLRNAYEGFEFSHASIMYNALKIDAVEKLVQVGIRDISHEEMDFIQENNKRVILYSDAELKKNSFEGISWAQQSESIVSHLPHHVYISFDIDGLIPFLCPNTGTPVAGGLELEQVFYLLQRIITSGRKIIGFDLCEVAAGESNDEWDANVGSRVLYKLCMLAAKQL